MSSGIALDGFDDFRNRINRAAKEIKEEVDYEMDASAKQIARDAQKSAPADLGALRMGISSFKVSDLTFEIVSSQRYSPYIEFGTGALVDVPQGLEDYAIQFKGKGIRQVNLPPRPYFIPAFNKEAPELIKRLKVILADL